MSNSAHLSAHLPSSISTPHTHLPFTLFPHTLLPSSSSFTPRLQGMHVRTILLIKKDIQRHTQSIHRTPTASATAVTLPETKTRGVFSLAPTKTPPPALKDNVLTSLAGQSLTACRVHPRAFGFSVTSNSPAVAFWRATLLLYRSGTLWKELTLPQI